MVNPILRDVHRLLTPLLANRDDIIPSTANPKQRLFVSASAADIVALCEFYRELGKLINGSKNPSSVRSSSKRIATQKRLGSSGVDGGSPT